MEYVYVTNQYRNKLYFEYFYDDTIDYKRKYVNDWFELRKFVGLDNIDLVDNELTIINISAYIKFKKDNFKNLRIKPGLLMSPFVY